MYGGTGCFLPAAGVSNGQFFGWELVLSFILVSTKYAVAVGNPSLGNVAPFAVGLSLIVDIFAGAEYFGHSFKVPPPELLNARSPIEWILAHLFLSIWQSAKLVVDLLPIKAINNTDIPDCR